MPMELSRRDVMKLISTAAFAAPLALPAAEGKPLFFTPDEFAMLDTLTELIIPADDHSPGAHEAGVAVYIDKSVSEAFLAKDKQSWQKGLAAVNQLSQSMSGKPFSKAGKQQQIAVLTKMASGENVENENKKAKPEQFFGQLKQTTVFAYYTSKIGIHDEIHYKGNVLLDKFVGYMPDAELPPISSLGELA